MEVRSSRRVRTLVTQMARSGLSANEIAPALIPMMVRSETLQSKAGYIDARPLPPYRQNSLATHGRTIHWVIRYRPASCRRGPMSAMPPIATRMLKRRDWSRCANRDRTHRSKPHRYSITSSARSSTDGGITRPSARAVLRLSTVAYLVGACTGSSAGFAPRRIRSTYNADCRYRSTKSVL